MRVGVFEEPLDDLKRIAMPNFKLSPALNRPGQDEGVIWFSESARLVRGRPDTRYGWLDTPNGPCIVKALDHELVAYADTLLAHEKFMLQCMAERGAPVCQWVPYARDGWLVTQFAGLSLRRLSRPYLLEDGQWGRALLALEHLSAWVHLMQRMAPMAAQGILMVDLHDGNVTLPLLEHGGQSGQLTLQRPCLIDHAHSLVAEAQLHRPLLIEPNSPYIAPELRPALELDHQRLRSHFQARGYSQLPEQRDEQCARIWAEYREPQAVLALVQSGEICADRAMQYAAGHALARGASQAIDAGVHPDIWDVLDQMLASDARRRYRDLNAAADALACCMPTLPKVSLLRLPRVTPGDIMAVSTPPDARPATAVADILTRCSVASPTPTMASHTTSASLMERLTSGTAPWAYWAVAAGAAAGTFLAR